MVTPAARRESVAYLRKAYEVSERRACHTTERIAARSVIDQSSRMMGQSVSVFAHYLRSGGGLAIAVYILCWRGRPFI